MVPKDRFLDRMTLVRVITASAPLRSEPAVYATLDNEGLYGEAFEVNSTENGFAFGALGVEGYQGWMPQVCLGDLPTPNACVITPMSHVTYDLDIKSLGHFSLSLGARVTVINQSADRARIATPAGSGFLPCCHILSLNNGYSDSALAGDQWPSNDWVTLAESLIGSPYKWGGRTAWGLDCSALVQLALSLAGISVPRDSGPQHDIGTGLHNDVALQRGDLVFWEGHVGIMQDPKQLLHANAYHMAVASEPLSIAKQRIVKTAGPVTALRRLVGLLPPTD